MVQSQVILSLQAQTEIIDSIDMAPLLSRIADKLGMSFSSDVVSSMVVSGGDSVVEYGGKIYHVFTTSGTQEFITNRQITAEYLIVAGGGAGSRSTGGGTAGGGGGAGGYRTGPLIIPVGSYTIRVGQGGLNTSTVGQPGQPSYIGSLVVVEGGGHGGCYSPASKGNGGSGGGGAYGIEPGAFGLNPSTPAPVLASYPNYVPGTIQGYPGGLGTSNSNQIGGGGGGAGGAGNSYIGGQGVQVPTTFRVPTISYGAPGPGGGTFWVAGGGGGAYYNPALGGPGGGPGGPYAGGGPGGGATSGTPGTANTGGGGGGVGNYDGNNAGAGGSGIVVIRYQV